MTFRYATPVASSSYRICMQEIVYSIDLSKDIVKELLHSSNICRRKSLVLYNLKFVKSEATNAHQIISYIKRKY